jgi:hypothetical protein
MSNVALLMERSLIHLKAGICRGLAGYEPGGYTLNAWRALYTQLEDINKNGITLRTDNFVFDNYMQLATVLSQEDLMAAASVFQHAIDNSTELVHRITTNIMDLIEEKNRDLSFRSFGSFRSFRELGIRDGY